MLRTGCRESGRKPPERVAASNRRKGIRSRYKRCDYCKKLRLYVPYANHHASAFFRDGAFTDWQRCVDGTQKCFICVEREAKQGAPTS